MKKKFGSYIKSLGIKSGEIIDVTGIKLDIRSLKRKREEIMLNMGSMVYRMFLKDRFDQERLSTECRRIAEIEKQIKSRENQIQKIHDSAKKSINKYLDKDKDESGPSS